MNRSYPIARVDVDLFIVSRCHWSYGESLQKRLEESYNSGPLAAMLVAPGGMSSIHEPVKRLTGRYTSKGEEQTVKVEGPSYRHCRSEMCLHFNTLGRVKAFLKTAEMYTYHYWNGVKWIMTDLRDSI